MDDDILTFEQLRNLQQKEQKKDTLQQLDNTFFKRVNQYLERKKQVGDHLDNREFRNAKHIVEDILDSRQKKILRLGFLSVKSNLQVDNLLSEEKVFFDKIQEQIKDHRGSLEEQVFSFDEKQQDVDDEPDQQEETDSTEGDDQDERNTEVEASEEEHTDDEEPDSDDTGDTDQHDTDDEDKLIEIAITADVPEFMGVDMSVYGPYEDGDTATVPEENADVLIEKDSAERVE